MVVTDFIGHRLVAVQKRQATISSIHQAEQVERAVLQLLDYMMLLVSH